MNVSNIRNQNFQYEIKDIKKNVIKETNNENFSNIERIKKDIENGSYKIDLNKTANKIIDYLI